MGLRLTRQQPCDVISTVRVGMMGMVKTRLLMAEPLLSSGGDGILTQEITGHLEPSLSLHM